MARRIGTARGDTLRGTNGADLIDGRAGNDRLFGLGGNDRILGGEGNDQVDGGEGDDRLDGGLGDDRLDGGLGFDLVSYAGVGRRAGSEFALDIVLLDDQDDTSFAVSAAGRDVPLNVEAVEGTAFRDRIAGSPGDNVLSGLGGDDEIAGLDGDDRLAGGTGNDELLGGDGDEVFAYEPGSDVFGGEGGFDTVDYSAAPAAVVGSGLLLSPGDGGPDRATAEFGGGLGEDGFFDVERVVGTRFGDLLSFVGGFGLDGAAFFAVEGRGGDDRIVSTTYNDRLLGGTGADTLEVRTEGEDRAAGEAGADLFFLRAPAGAVGRTTVTDFARGSDLLDLELLGDDLRGQAVFDLLDSSGDGRLDAGDDRVSVGRVSFDGARVQALTVDVPAGDGSAEWRFIGLGELLASDLGTAVA